MKLTKNKKGQVFTQLAGLATGIATLAITLTVAFLVMSQGKTQLTGVEDYCTGNSTTPVWNSTGLNCHNATWTNITNNAGFSEAWNGTSLMQNATDDVATWVPLVIIASIGAILLGLVALFRK